MRSGPASSRIVPSSSFCLASEAEGLLAAGREAWLSPREEAAFQRFATEKRRRDWLAGRVAAKRALGGGPELELDNEPSGRPFLRGRPDVSFSIAHCAEGGLCAVAAPGGRVGVDWEPVIERAPEIFALVAEPGELERARGARGRTRLWTAKEAVLKLLGLGLACDPRSVLWRDDRGEVELAGAARSRWRELGAPDLSVEHRDLGGSIAAFAFGG